MGSIVDGCPAGLLISEKDIQKDLNRRRPGQGEVTTARSEKDTVEILSGVFEGQSLGTPISMIIKNRDVDSSAYKELKDTPRPGHADLTWEKKFGLRDWRGGGRASARETAGRVAAGAIAKKLIKDSLGIDILAHAKQIGAVSAAGMEIEGDLDKYEDIVYSNPLRTLDLERSKDMEDEILSAKSEGDSVGGIVECIAVGAPIGLGEPVFDKITAELAYAICSIPAVKGIEFGIGFEAAGLRGSENNDEIAIQNKKIVTRTNKAGGVLGGITNGMPIVFRVAFKPTASISQKQRTIDLQKGREAEISIKGRHDPCIVPRAVPVVEAMAAIVLADLGLRSGMIPRSLKK